MVTPQEEGVEVKWQKEMVDKAEPKVLNDRARGLCFFVSLFRRAGCLAQ